MTVLEKTKSPAVISHRMVRNLLLYGFKEFNELNLHLVSHVVILFLNSFRP